MCVRINSKNGKHSTLFCDKSAKNCHRNLDVTKICITFVPDSETNYMVDVAQLVRVTDCGSEGRGFESHLPPLNVKASDRNSVTCFVV